MKEFAFSFHLKPSFAEEEKNVPSYRMVTFFHKLWQFGI
jgi:hypothetical protein